MFDNGNYLSWNEIMLHRKASPWSRAPWTAKSMRELPKHSSIRVRSVYSKTTYILLTERTRMKPSSLLAAHHSLLPIILSSEMQIMHFKTITNYFSFAF